MVREISILTSVARSWATYFESKVSRRAAGVSSAGSGGSGPTNRGVTWAKYRRGSIPHMRQLSTIE
jgi:hypothetical protein